MGGFEIGSYLPRGGLKGYGDPARKIGGGFPAADFSSCNSIFFVTNAGAGP
jgi:hypothetical protein